MSVERQPVGFLVWNPAQRMPSYRHETFDGAEVEVERLRAEYPDQTFWIMAPVKGERAAGAAKAFSDGKAEGMAQAHAEIMLAEGRCDRMSEELYQLRQTVRELNGIAANRVEFQATVADCLLWFDGFNAAHRGKEPWERPHTPDRDKITRLNAALQALLRAGADEEIPF